MKSVILTIRIASKAQIAEGQEFDLEAQRFGRASFDISLGRTTNCQLKVTFREGDPHLNFSRYKFRVVGRRTPSGWVTINRDEEHVIEI